MPLTSNERRNLNNAFDAAFSAVQSAQASYITSRQRYAQVLSGGGTRTPAYQQDSLTVNIPVEISVDQYIGRQGAGWTLIGEYNVRGGVYVRARTDGPVPQFTHDWIQESPIG